MTERVASASEQPGVARILIVDDEGANVVALCHVLRDEGYTVEGTTSSREALQRLQAASYDVLMTDLCMPEMDGMSLIRAAHEIDRDLAAVIMTGQGSIEGAVDALKGGAEDYVQKPLQLSVVIAVLRRALSARGLRVENRTLVERLRERTRELEAANSELEAFSYSVSHDLRGPLRAIGGFRELLELDYGDQLPADARDHLRQIRAGVDRMNALIDDMLKLAQLSRSPVEKVDVDMQELVSNLLARMARETRETRARVEVGTLRPARGNPGLLEQVFTNLLSNAFKYSRGVPDPRVWIDSTMTAEGPTYRVRDNGVGFSSADSQRLFAPFQRFHDSAVFEGTGVGLSIVRRIVQRHGGQIWAESEKGKGATFYFTLAR